MMGDGQFLSGLWAEKHTGRLITSWVALMRMMYFLYDSVIICWVWGETVLWKCNDEILYFSGDWFSLLVERLILNMFSFCRCWSCSLCMKVWWLTEGVLKLVLKLGWNLGWSCSLCWEEAVLLMCCFSLVAMMLDDRSASMLAPP